MVPETFGKLRDVLYTQVTSHSHEWTCSSDLCSSVADMDGTVTLKAFRLGRCCVPCFVLKQTAGKSTQVTACISGLPQHLGCTAPVLPARKYWQLI